MKSPATKMIPPRITPPVPHVPADSTPAVGLDGELDSDTLFLLSAAKAGNFTAKDFQFVLRVNKTTAYSWFNGSKKHPLKRARDVVTMFREAGKLWLIPSILEYIAGSDFDGAILTAEEQHALIVLAKAITK